MNRGLWHFHGGLRLPDHKAESTAEPVRPARLPKRIVLPLNQHVGEPAEPLVETGERVLKGQPVARARGYISAPVHASTSGTVIDVGDHPVPHPSGLNARCIVIEPDGHEEWRWRRDRIEDYTALSPSELRNRIRRAGIVGLGGAAFPTHVKINPGPGADVHTLIINGAECEPYISCDEMLMREHPRRVLAGACALRHVVGAKRCIVALEDNEPEAAERLEGVLSEAGDETIEVVRVPTLYPTGGEKQLIKVLTGREVPSNGLPTDIGVLVQNVATASAVHRALAESEPLVSRYVTVSGDAVREPRTLEVLIGTPFADVIDQCGGYTSEVERLVMGGPMMGFAVASDEAPVVKATNCILALDRRSVAPARDPMPCIRCGECAVVCPAELLPQQLYWHARARNLDEAQGYNLFDCIECGLCAYVCPSHLPLVQYFRFAKDGIWAREREQNQAEHARRRYEFRLERLERDKREREERTRRKKETVKDADAGDRKQAIADAVARSKAKRERRPDDGDNAGQQPVEESDEPRDRD